MGKIMLNGQALIESGGAPNIRYNPETDMIQCYFEGEWIDWKLASIAWDGYLYKYGVGISKYGFSGGEISNSAMSFGWSAPGTSASAWGYHTYTTKTKFDVTNYKSLILDSTLNSDSSYNDTIVVGLSDNNSSNSSMTKTIVSGNNTSYNRCTKTLDLSTLEGEYYFKIYGGAAGWGWQSLTIYNLYLTT